MIVVNSSPLIILAKQGLLHLLEKCFQKAIIPKSVYEEIMQKKDNLEGIALEKAIKDKLIIVKKTDVIHALDTKNIGQGEKEAISLASKHKSILIVDDDSAKKYASLFGVEAHGTLFIIYLSCIRKIIDRGDSIDILEGMIEDGFYISAETYRRFFELLDSLKKSSCL